MTLPRRKPPRTPPLHGYRILIVEDQFLIALWLCDAVADRGATAVGPVGTLQEGLDTAGRETLHGALLDVNLGDELVYPLAQDLRQRGVPVIFLSGGHGQDIPPSLQDVPWLRKPVSPDRLGQEMGRVFINSRT